MLLPGRVLQTSPARPTTIALLLHLTLVDVVRHWQALLWGLDDDMDAEATAVLLEERGVMRVACLADGTAWALVDPALLQRLQAGIHLAHLAALRVALDSVSCWGAAQASCVMGPLIVCFNAHDTTLAA